VNNLTCTINVFSYEHSSNLEGFLGTLSNSTEITTLIYEVYLETSVDKCIYKRWFSEWISGHGTMLQSMKRVTTGLVLTREARVGLLI